MRAMGDGDGVGARPLRLVHHRHPPPSSGRRVIAIVLDRLNDTLEHLKLALLGGSGNDEATQKLL
jgi:hypothetical protein